MKTAYFYKPFSFLSVLALLLSGVFITGIKAVKADDQAPYFFANPSGKWVYASNWPDPNTEFTFTKGDISLTSTNGYFDLSGKIDLVPGDSVTVSGGGIEKSLTITNVTIINMDVATDTMTGTASPNGSVCVVPDNTSGNARCTNVGEDGGWQIAPEEGGFVLKPGVYGWVGEWDEDGDITRMNWSVPNPTARALLSENRIETYGWLLDKNLELTIVDGPQKYTTSLVTTPCSWDSSCGYASFELGPDFTLAPDQLITVSDGNITKTLNVMDLYVETYDPILKTVTGHSDQGSNVQVNMWIDGGSREVVTDSSGNWQVVYDTFTDPFLPWYQGDATVSDDDGDSTVYRINYGNIFAWVPGLVELQNVTKYRKYDLTIDDPSNGSGVDYSDSVLSQLGEGGTHGDVEFQLDNFTLQPGDLVTVSSGHDVRTLVVLPKGTISFDPINDVISGENQPNNSLAVDTANWRNASTDTSGHWSIDYKTHGPNNEPPEDIYPGMNGWVYERDSDDDFTAYGWRVPNPSFSARANGDQVEAYEWTLGDELTVSVNGFNETKTVEGMAPWDPNITYLSFDLAGKVDIKAGDTLSVSNGSLTKTTIVTDLAIITIDTVNETVIGQAQPGLIVDTWVCDQDDICGNRHVIPDREGNWTADFSHPGVQDDEQSTFDLVRGSWVDSQQTDEDGDRTMFGAKSPNPLFQVRANSDQVEALEWTLGDQLILSVNGYSETKIVGEMAPWDPNMTYVSFDLAGKVDIKAGDTVSVSNGDLTKTTLVTDLAVTGFDLTNDTVSGQAQPGLVVDTWICDQNGCYNRHVMPDGEGKWTVDYAHPGNAGDEQSTFDLVGATWIDSQQTDEDDDRTMFGANAPNPRFDVRAQYDQVQVWEWGVGDKITVSVNGRAFQETVVANSTRDDGLTYQEFNLAGLVDIKPGDSVSVSNGDLTKSTVVTELKFTDIDNEKDIVTGTTAPGSSFSIWACGSEGCFDRNVTADGFGNWLADFSQPGENGQNTVDLTYNIWVDSRQSDDDSDGTMYGVTNPWPHHHIFTYNIKTRNSTQVTKNPDFSEENPNWAPAGKKFVHDVFTHDGTQYIAVTDLITHTTVPLKGGEGGDDPVWSPNGLWFAYNSMYTNTANIYIIPFKGGRKTLVHENGTSPAWSPNGQRLVFVDLGDGDKVKTISYLGRQEITVAGRGYNPAWSPDGKWIAYELDGDIWKVRVDSLGHPMSKPIQLTHMDGWESQPAWSPDSTTIIFQHGLDYDVNFDTMDIWKVSGFGGKPSLFFGNPSYGDFDPDYLDNAFIAYCQYVEQLNHQMQIR